MPESDVELLISAARAAGEIASRYWQKSPKVWDKAANAGPVTEADISVNDMLQDVLISARPGYGWLSEESEDSPARLSCERSFIIDPIDGTRSFIAGEKTWAHSLAIVENKQIIAGVVYLPQLDKLYQAFRGQGAYLNGQKIQSSSRSGLANATLLAARSNLDAEHWANGPPPVTRVFRPSLAYRMALVAEGRFDAMLTLRDTWEWDVAAGTLIASEAGAQVTDRYGHAVSFNNKIPTLPGLIAGTDLVHSELCRLLV